MAGARRSFAFEPDEGKGLLAGSLLGAVIVAVLDAVEGREVCCWTL